MFHYSDRLKTKHRNRSVFPLYISTGKVKRSTAKKVTGKADARERKLAHAVLHPTRLDVLSILFERPASPNELARILGLGVSTASHHVTELVKDDVIELIKTVPRRGAVEHFYRARTRPAISAEEWRALPRASRRDIAALALQEIVGDSLAALRQGKLEDDDDMYLVWVPMRLSEKGQAEVTELQAEVLERLEAIKARDAARNTEGSDAGPVRIAATLWFERGKAGGKRADGPPRLD